MIRKYSNASAVLVLASAALLCTGLAMHGSPGSAGKLVFYSGSALMCVAAGCLAKAKGYSPLLGLGNLYALLVLAFVRDRTVSPAPEDGKAGGPE